MLTIAILLPIWTRPVSKCFHKSILDEVNAERMSADRILKKNFNQIFSVKK